MPAPDDAFSQVKRFAEQGCSDYAISRQTGIPRATVQRWRHRNQPPRGRRAPEAADWQVTEPAAYCYLLGAYLGDGNLLHGRCVSHWQLELTREHPEAFVRGLIHSDGCRSINCFKTVLPSGRVCEYSYARYFFTNLSADIRDLFVHHCGLLGVRVTQPSERNLAISDRASVAVLEEIVGPKL